MFLRLSYNHCCTSLFILTLDEEEVARKKIEILEALQKMDKKKIDKIKQLIKEGKEEEAQDYFLGDLGAWIGRAGGEGLEAFLKSLFG